MKGRAWDWEAAFPKVLAVYYVGGRYAGKAQKGFPFVRGACWKISFGVPRKRVNSRCIRFLGRQ